MRQNQNQNHNHNQNQNAKRARGRGARRPGNSVNRPFESNGPDVKIRGTAAHILEKYQSLSRDANVAGDRISAENYLQHAEHYHRLMLAAQQAQQAQQQPQQQQPKPQETSGEAPSGAAPGGKVESSDVAPVEAAPEAPVNGSGSPEAAPEAGNPQEHRRRKPSRAKTSVAKDSEPVATGEEPAVEASSAEGEEIVAPVRKRRTRRTKVEIEESKTAEETDGVVA